nr:hypothetical protein [Tanacetum cinerariifolium]
GGLEVTTQEALKLLIKWAHHKMDPWLNAVISGNYVKMTYLLTYFDRDIPGRMLDGFGRSTFEIAES